MKILILGGTGTISTSITRELLEHGEDVTLYNRGTTPARFPDEAKLLHGDRFDYAAFEHQMHQAGHFDCVIDMICFTQEHVESVERAFRGRIGQLIFCSTVNVYSKPAPHYPIDENTERNPVRDTYGLNKALCEDLLLEAHQRGDFAVTILRPAHTYGDTGTIIHSIGRSTFLIDRLRCGLPVIVHGDGSSFWVTCHSDDVGHAFVQAIGNEKTYGRAYHVTGEEWMTWDHYHQIVAQAASGPEPRLIHIPTDLLAKIAPRTSAATITNYAGNNLFDNSAARADLDFHPRISWLEGSKRTIAWLDEHGKIENSDAHPFYARIIAEWERLSEEIGLKFSGDNL